MGLIEEGLQSRDTVWLNTGPDGGVLPQPPPLQ